MGCVSIYMCLCMYTLMNICLCGVCVCTLMHMHVVGMYFDVHACGVLCTLMHMDVV